MSENYPLGGTMTFTPDEGVEVALSPAPITKGEALRIGVDFCEAGDPEREALLAELGPVMLCRNLLVLSNVALRVGDSEAAAYARDLRDRIEVVRGSKKVAS